MTDQPIDYAKAVKDLTSKDDKFFITLLSDPETLARVEQWISTRCLPLDKITGGGFPVRRITEIYGDNSTGKTLLATQAAIATQEMGGDGSLRRRGSGPGRGPYGSAWS